ncbi:MAG: efflux RND transporter periplasmic adaptor subunit [Alphaproteobacteria bacterium]|nr:efflux RND transporter periplasmic adaptor subunit [Alphaproteobacteria bacterium]MBV9692746.1 efflux RND transporter periplasmic adaptor subunit [Alphaproteobacteria bacterium]
MMMRKFGHAPLVAGALVALGVAFMVASRPPQAVAQQAPPPAPPPPSVGVSTARLVKMAPKVSLPGTVVSRSDSQLASEVEGRIAWVAEVGTAVKQGDVVARIDNKLASLQLQSDKSNAARLAAQLRYDREQAARMDNLFNQSAIAKSTRDQALSTKDMDSAALAQAEASFKKSQYQFSHSDIRAPFSGRVVARLINAGEYATPGKPVVRLVDTQSLEVSVQSPIDTARNVAEGTQLAVELQGKSVPARVRAIVPVGDIASRTIEVRLALPAGAGLVGDAAKVFMPSDLPRDVVAVPRDALVLREESTYVFKVDRKDKAQRVAVETGAEEGAMVEIKGAVTPGDRVIVRGAERLEAGQKVKAVRAS